MLGLGVLDGTPPSLNRMEKFKPRLSGPCCSSWILQPFLFTMCTSGLMYSSPHPPAQAHIWRPKLARWLNTEHLDMKSCFWVNTAHLGPLLLLRPVSTAECWLHIWRAGACVQLGQELCLPPSTPPPCLLEVFALR